jgi:hypothetical protein
MQFTTVNTIIPLNICNSIYIIVIKFINSNFFRFVGI